jgi:hypothetical protein
MSTPRTHPLNVGYLVVGLVFLGVAASWALRTSGVVDGNDGRWLVPAVLLVSGIVGLVAFAAKGVTRSRDAGRPPYDVEEPEPTVVLPYLDEGDQR